MLTVGPSSPQLIVSCVLVVPALILSSSLLAAVTEISTPGRRRWTPRKLKTGKEGGEDQGRVLPGKATRPAVNLVSSFSRQFLFDDDRQ